MSNLIDTQGMSLKMGDGLSPETFTQVPRVTSIDPIPNASGKPLRDVTDLSHTDTRKHKFGLADMPEITVEGFFDPDDTTHTALATAHENGTVTNFQVVLTDGTPTTYSFSALVSMQISAPLDGDVPFTLTLKPQSRLTKS